MSWPLLRVEVAERSMEPTLREGDWLLVWSGCRPGRLSTQLRGARRARAFSIKPGQLVVSRHPQREDMLLIKRAARLEPGGWWLESDNPAAGAVDSGRFGPVPPALIVGRVLLRYRSAKRLPAARRPTE